MSSLAQPWVLWALLAAVFAALTAILAKLGVAGIDSDVATFVRTLVVAGVLALLLAGRGLLSTVPGVPMRALAFLTLSGLTTGASWLCYFRALKLGEASRVAPIDKLSVVLVAIFGVLFLGESLTFLHWLGIAAIAGGVLLLLT